MPREAPGERYSATATKATTHGAPAVEVGHAGIAAKSQQIPPMVPSVANAAIAQTIGIGEEFVIMMSGQHEVPVADLPVGAAVGDPLWITAADNSLAAAAGAGLVKFGVIDEIDTTTGRALVNLTQRSSF